MKTIEFKTCEMQSTAMLRGVLASFLQQKHLHRRSQVQIYNGVRGAKAQVWSEKSRHACSSSHDDENFLPIT